MKKVGIIQARLNSKRLPNKMLMNLGNIKILDWVIHRVKKSKHLDEIVVAIPETKENDILEDFLDKKNCKLFRGSENDVLGRFFNVARKYKADIIIRICADNPLIDPIQIDDLISKFRFTKYDYAFNHQNKMNSNYADGFGAEIFTISTLDKLNNIAYSFEHREHVTLYIWENLPKFKIQLIKAKNELAYPDLKFDIVVLAASDF